MEEKKDVPPASVPGIEVVVNPPWGVMRAMPEWVQLMYVHPRLGELRFLVSALTAKAMSEALRTAIDPSAPAADSPVLGPMGPYH